jgi:hypothetical protein
MNKSYNNENKTQCDIRVGCGKFKFSSEFTKRQLRASGIRSSTRPKRCRECIQRELICRETIAQTKRLKKMAGCNAMRDCPGPSGSVNRRRCLVCTQYYNIMRSPADTKADIIKTNNYIKYITNEASIIHTTFTIRQPICLGLRTVAFLFKMPTPTQLDSEQYKNEFGRIFINDDSCDDMIRLRQICDYTETYDTLCTKIAGDFATNGDRECNTCRERAAFLGLLIGRPSNDNPTGLVFCTSTINRNYNQRFARNAVKKMLYILTELNVPLGIHIISNCDPCILARIHSGNEPRQLCKEWIHYSAQCDRKSDVGIDGPLYQAAYSQYMWQALEMLNGFSHQYNNWREPLQLIKNLIRGRCDNLPPSFCEPIPYANKYIPCIDWMLELVNDWEAVGDYSSFNEQYLKEQIVIASAIIRTDVCTQAGQTIMSNFTERHTIIGWLNNVRSAAEMRSIIVCHVNPINHIFPTNTLGTKQISQAINMLGNFHMRMMLVEEAMKLGASKLIGEGANMQNINYSSSNAMRDLMDNARHKNNLASFANRMNSSSHEWKTNYEANLTMIMLHQQIKKGIIWKLEVNTSDNTVAYAATTNLDSCNLCVPHPWAFINNDRTSPFRFNQYKPKGYINRLDQTSPNSAWGEVSHVYHIPTTDDKYYINIFILVDGREVLKHGAVAGRKIPNCCIPSFLTAACRRTCGSTFEALNDTMDVIIPDGPLAIGIGVNNIDNTGMLAQFVQIKINNENRWRSITHSF